MIRDILITPTQKSFLTDGKGRPCLTPNRSDNETIATFLIRSNAMLQHRMLKNVKCIGPKIGPYSTVSFRNLNANMLLSNETDTAPPFIN